MMMLRNQLNSALQLIFANIIDYHIVAYHMVHMIRCSVGCETSINYFHHLDTLEFRLKFRFQSLTISLFNDNQSNFLMQALTASITVSMLLAQIRLSN